VLRGLKPEMACAPRNIYIDMGVNWCNSLSYFHSGAIQRLAHHGVPWEIWGFEANPLIAPFADKCMQALSLGQPLPKSPVPPAGSTDKLVPYSHELNCSASQFSGTKGTMRYKMMKCMQHKLRGVLCNLRPDPALSELSTITPRLSRAQCSRSREARRGRDEYTFLAAAAGNRTGSIDLTLDHEKIIHGGGHSSCASCERSVVPVVDVVRWMLGSFRRADFVFLKMDIEGPHPPSRHPPPLSSLLCGPWTRAHRMIAHPIPSPSPNRRTHAPSMARGVPCPHANTPDGWHLPQGPSSTSWTT
jgi:hypothetical protein